MKKFGIWCICLLLIASCLVIPAHAEDGDKEIPLSVAAGCHSIDAKLSMIGSGQLLENAESVILFENNSQTLMYDWNADLMTDPASLVKIMTALVALENGNLDDLVLVSESALSSLSAGAVSVDLQVGELITLEELVYCLLVGSANDAANVIAEHIGGSDTEFINMMNRRAEELGCAATHYINAHGLYHKDQYTTARDTVRILSAAIKNEKFLEIFTTATHTVPATNLSEERKLITGNYLISTDVMEIYYDSRVLGGRTGAANDGTRCIAALSESNGMQMISVVFGTKSVFEEDGQTIRSYGGFAETISLLNRGFEGYKITQIINKNQVIQQLTVINGDNDVFIGTKNAASIVLPVSLTTTDLEFRYTYRNEALEAPLDKDVLIAELQVWYRGICVAESELYSMNAVQTYTPLPPDPVLEEDSVVVPVILVIVGLLVLAFVANRLLQRHARNKRREQRRRPSVPAKRPDRRRR